MLRGVKFRFSQERAGVDLLKNYLYAIAAVNMLLIKLMMSDEQYRQEMRDEGDGRGKHVDKEESDEMSDNGDHTQGKERRDYRAHM